MYPFRTIVLRIITIRKMTKKLFIAGDMAIKAVQEE